MGAAPATGLASAPAPAEVSGVEGMLAKYACTACHTVATKGIGPSFAEVAAKYRGQKDAVEKLAEKVKSGGSGVWGQVPMPPNPTLPDKELHTIVEWILAR